MNSTEDQEQAATFAKVFQDELKGIGKNKGSPLIGLALSGGGIRSATFNLGVIQGLAENKVFDKFDYLSTVSGGGYIGSWLSAWIYRKSPKGGATIQADLAASIDANNEQSKPVDFLRDYSNYLTPRSSLFSMDTLSAFATYIRNLILNQSILILALALVLTMPRFLQKGGDFLLQTPGYFCYVFAIDALFLVAAIGMISYNLTYTDLPQTKTSQPEGGKPGGFLVGSLGVFVGIVIPILISGWLTALILTHLAKVPSWIIVLGSGGIYLALWATAYSINKLIAMQRPAGQSAGTCTASEWAAPPMSRIKKTAGTGLPELLQWAGFTFVAGCIGGALFLAVIHLLASMEPVLIPWLAVVFGPPAVVSIFALIVIFHVGLMGRDFSVAQHEWWSRLGAPLIAAMAAWLGVFGIAVFGPPALDSLDAYLSATLTSGWLASTLAGVWAGKSSATGGKGGSAGLERVAQIAPYVFVIGVLIAVSSGLQWVYSPQGGVDQPVVADYCRADGKATASPCFSGLVKSELAKMNAVTCKTLAAGFAGMFVAAWVLAWRVKLNLFSLHNFYRNRLTRAYLGASRPDRNPHPFTGFDEDDDIALSELAGQRPYHIINTAINFTDGGKLAVQDRKAGSFVFTPRYCGYQDAGPSSDFYRDSKAYGKADGFRLGSAVAISGAAASPNMGYHSSPAVAFLLTFFNVRLGRWCGNPAIKDVWKESDPMFGFVYLLSELFGYSSLKSRFVNLSDGGHFENTGLYELVRRQCKHIVVCDAGADENFNFEDLAGAIRKCRTDFGVEIKMDNLDGLRLKPGNRFSRRHYATGKIVYDADPSHDGTLLLLKPSLTDTADFPDDVRNYADMNETFPQQSTADQWFDEAQFESYRKLGYHVVQSLFADKAFDKTLHGF